MTSPTIRSLCASAAIVAALGMGGCSPSTTESGPRPDASAASSKESAAVTVQDAWVKAADAGMSAAFGVLTNSSERAIRVTAAASDASASVEMHETVPSADGGMQMRQKRGGFVIPAGGELVLQPGGNHLMLMGLKSPVRPGDDVKLSLTFGDGSTYEVTAAAKTFTGANEKYAG